MRTSELILDLIELGHLQPDRFDKRVIAFFKKAFIEIYGASATYNSLMYKFPRDTVTQPQLKRDFLENIL